MPTNPEFGRRLREAKRALEMRRDKDLTFEEIGRVVGAALGRAAYSHQGVRKWFVLGTEPTPYAVVEALAAVLGVRAAWLFTGDGPMLADASAPDARRPPGTPLVGPPQSGPAVPRESLDPAAIEAARARLDAADAAKGAAARRRSSGGKTR